MNNKNETLKWISSLANNKISFENGIEDETKNRGIYGIFVIDTKLNNEYCAYVGRALNIYSRFLSGSKAHFVKLKNGNLNNNVINHALNNADKRIEVRVLEFIEFSYQNYCKDVQYMASRECYYIDKYQAINQCLEQYPDGKNIDKNVWQKEKHNRYQ